MMEAVYFGCWGRVGHHYYLPNGRSASYKKVDATDITPWGYGVEDLAPHTMEQGTAALVHRGGWTALAVDDFTVDSRGNSKSVFCFQADLDRAHVLLEIARTFPEVAKRVGPVDIVSENWEGDDRTGV